MNEPRRIRTSDPRSSLAREACLDQYAAAYERFATREQELRAEGKTAETEGAHRYALWVLRAYEAESR